MMADDDFVIHRRKPKIKDDTIASIVRIKRYIKHNDTRSATKAIDNFTPGFEFEHELFIAKRYISLGDLQKGLDVVESVRKTLFARYIGAIYLAKRVIHGNEIGDLHQLPNDILQTIVN